MLPRYSTQRNVWRVCGGMRMCPICKEKPAENDATIVVIGLWGFLTIVAISISLVACGCVQDVTRSYRNTTRSYSYQRSPTTNPLLYDGDISDYCTMSSQGSMHSEV